MKNKRKHFIKKVTAIVTMACMITCSSNSAIIVPVIAGEQQESLTDLQDSANEVFQNDLGNEEKKKEETLKADLTEPAEHPEKHSDIVPEKDSAGQEETPEVTPEEQVEKPEQLDQPTQTEKPELEGQEMQTGKPEQTDKPEQADKPEQTDKPEQADKMEQADQPGQMENQEQGTDTAQKEDSGELTDQADQKKEEILQENTEEDKTETRLTSQTNGVEITLLAQEGAFPLEGELTLSVEEIVDERLEKAKDVIESKMLTEDIGLSSYRLFDVTPLLDGTEIQPTKPVKVSFRNLELDQGNGKSIDVRKELEDSGKVVITETSESGSPEAPVALSISNEEESVVLYHFTDEETPEKLEAAADTEEIVTEWNHFSWIFAGGLTERGKDYTWNFEDEGGEYTLDYILSHYNVFVSGDYLGSHVVGPMVVGGETRGNGFGGYSHALEGETEIRKYPHQVPSYFEGYIYKTEDSAVIPNIKLDRTDLPVYLGRYNFQGNAKREQDFKNNNPYAYYLTPKSAYTGSSTCDYSKMYVDFGRVFPKTPSIPGRNLNPPGYADKDRPKDHHDKGNMGRYSWLNGTKDGHVSVSNDGKLYGSDKISGSIKYYQNFEGYDISSKYVSKVSVTQKHIQDVLDASNSRADKANGYTRYFDEYGNKVDALDNMTIEQINGMEGAKDMYAFFISTKGITINKDHPDYTEVALGFRLGHNFTFESFNNIDKLIYDYVSEQEMDERLTVIQVMEAAERLVFPYINKISSNDGYGSTSEFGSIEGDKNCSVLFFAPNVEQVYVGYKDENTTGGPGLTGHLVVPQADVWLAGGNFNGCVIARNVDARGTEGHMWPFQGFAAAKGIHIEGQKSVDGRKPNKNEIFSFDAVLEEIETGKIWSYQKQNSESGKFRFDISESTFTDQFHYKITVKETDLSIELAKKYVKDPVVYVGTFTVEKDLEGNVKPLQISWMKHVNGKTEEAGEKFTASELAFNNNTPKAFHITKKWKDEMGNPIAGGEGCPSVTVNLYKTEKKAPGKKVTVKIYSGTEASKYPSGFKEISTIELGEAELGTQVKFQVECTDKYNFDGEKPTAGIKSVEADSPGIQSKPYGEKAVFIDSLSGTEITIPNIQNDVTVQVYFQRYSSVKFGTLCKPPRPGATPSPDMFTTKVTKMQVTKPDFEPLEKHFVESRVMSKDNNWSLTWDQLPKTDSDGNLYYYKVVEESGNYDTEYSGGVFSLDETGAGPEVVITNTKKKPVNTTLSLKKTDADSKILLAGAEFRLTNYDTGDQLHFIKKAAGVYEYVPAASAESQSMVVTSADAGNEGCWKINKLPFGKYILEETVSPAGYAREEQKLEIQINEDGSAVILNAVTPEFAQIIQSNELETELSFTNKAGVELPGTGGMGTNGFHMGGISLMGTALALTYLEMIRRRKEEEGVRSCLKNK